MAGGALGDFHVLLCSSKCGEAALFDGPADGNSSLVAVALDLLADLEAEALVFDEGGFPFWPEPLMVMVLRRLQFKLSKLATRIYDTHLSLATTFFKVEETDSITPLQAAVRPYLLRVIYVVAWITLSRKPLLLSFSSLV